MLSRTRTAVALGVAVASAASALTLVASPAQAGSQASYSCSEETLDQPGGEDRGARSAHAKRCLHWRDGGKTLAPEESARWCAEKVFFADGSGGWGGKSEWVRRQCAMKGSYVLTAPSGKQYKGVYPDSKRGATIADTSYPCEAGTWKLDNDMTYQLFERRLGTDTEFGEPFKVHHTGSIPINHC